MSQFRKCIYQDVKYNISSENSCPNLEVSVSNDNVTDEQSHQSYQDIAILIEQCMLPVICLLGLVGNTGAAVVFLQRPLRVSSCSIYLASRSISDNGFLATLFVVWISSTFQLHLSHVRGLCQILVFSNYVFSCVSVWLVVFVTVENYIRICKPFLVRKFCKTRNAKINIAILLVLAMCCYNFPFWSMDKACTPLKQFFKFIQVLVYSDTFITLVIPTVIMAVLMAAITVSVLKSCNRRRRFSVTAVNRPKHPVGKITRLLYSVTVSFVCLNLPSHVVRLRLMARSFLKENKNVSSTDANIQTVALLIYYISMSINVFVYYTFGSKFRTVFKETFLRRGKASSVGQHYSWRKCTFSNAQGSGKADDERSASDVFHFRRAKSW